MKQYCYLFLFLCLISCNTNQENSNNRNSSDEKAIQSIEIKYAKNFSIQVYDAYKVLNIHQGNYKQKYILHKKGKTLPAKLKSEPNIIQIPIRKIAVLSHTHIAFLQALGLEDKIVAVNETAYLPDENILNKIKNSKVQDLGIGDQVNEEILLALEADVLMLSTPNAESNKNLQNIKNAGTVLMSNLEWQETTALGRLEWIKFMGILFNKEKEAQTYFNAIEKKYIKAKKIAQKAEKKPTVFCQVPYKSVWYMPGGKSFVASLLQDANANYLWKEDKNTGSLNLDFEVVYAKASKADYWINLGIHQKKTSLLAQDKRFADFKAFKDNMMYNNHKQIHKNGGNKFFMEGVLKPHLILKDYIKILHPKLLQDYTMTYFEKLP